MSLRDELTIEDVLRHNEAIRQGKRSEIRLKTVSDVISSKNNKNASTGQQTPGIGTSEAKSKYGNQKVIIDGHTFASKKEGQRYRELKLMEHAKIISDLQIQVAFHLVVNDVKLGKYIADFVYDRDDEKVIEDVKGWRDKSSPVYRLFKLKAKLVEAIYGIEVIEI